MNRRYAFLPVILIAAVLVSGCTAYDGSPPKVGQDRIDAVAAAGMAWLASAEGQEMFGSGSLGAPLAVFTMNRTFEHWVLPVMDSSGMYTGFIITKNDDFRVPELGVTKYADPRRHLFSNDKSEAYQAILESSVYTADSIKEPYLTVIEGKGYHWTSETVANGKFISKKSVPISIIDPHDEDNALKNPAL